MGLSFTTGDNGFTIDGLTISGANMSNAVSNITIKNSAFTAALVFSGGIATNANILIDHDTFNNISNPSCTGEPARIHVAYSSTQPIGVTVQNSLFSGGDTDGMQLGTGLNVFNNEFTNIKEASSSDCNHTDSIQLYSGTGAVIRGNYIHDNDDGIVGYDGVEHVTIENNVIDLINGRYGLELYSDAGSIVRHNTLRYATTCSYAPCGVIILDRKTADPAGTDTVVQDNIATSVELNDGSTAAVNTKNMLHSGASGTNFNGIPVFVSGSAPTTWAGFKLAYGSPGIGAATDDLNVGIN